MDQGILALIIVLAMGVFSKNDTVAVGTSLLIFLKLANIPHVIPFLEDNGLKLGITVMMAGVLAPFASGRITITDISNSLKSPITVLYILAGLVTVAFAGRGAEKLYAEPSVILGIFIGSILGIVLFKGVPVGPMTAAGIVTVILALGKLFN